ncbi:predicted protein [Nematostella vectensis]|uniref:PB1 domain-containing protein n=1 Tax=Nematostella vectensis TaxID=45351 RepID=A7RP45_NEMVE|nr:predicted protein [Nematostella vectensis]|eukprot:XP_001638912.1 predicted protein [Nematostella vectensis]
MFITVLYGDEESLLFNPSCTVVNLLDNIRERCGFSDSGNILDLTDQTGLVLELTDHQSDNASKYLTQKAEYILVEKRVQQTSTSEPNSSPSQDITYVPLLNKLDKFPNYQMRVAQPSPSPASTGGGKHGKTRKGKRRKANGD